MMKFSYKVIILLLITSYFITFGEWQAVRVGDTPGGQRPYCVCVGDGRNDGKERVYVSNFNNHIYEWSYYPDSGWLCMDVGEGAPDHHGMIGVTVGQGRNDGINRVYSGHANRWIYEFTYSSGQWLKDSLNPSSNSVYFGVQVGEGRNDGVKRVYGFGGSTVQGKEYTWDASSDTWMMRTASQPHYVWYFSIGDGRNDGIKRIYGTHYQGRLNTSEPSLLLENTWNGSTFVENQMLSRSSVITQVGQGRSDGINRVYVAATGDHVYEYTYNAENWEEIDICPDAPYLTRCGLAIGKAQSDGHIRVYSTGIRPYGDVREHTWDGSNWTDTVIDAVTMATTHLALGPGRGDDTMRLYASDINGVVWEFTHPSPYVASVEESKGRRFVKNTKILPTPSVRNAVINYSLEKGSMVKIDIYNLSGQIVRNLLNTFHQPGNYQALWDTRDNYGRALPSGVYLCRLKTSEGFTDTKQIIIMK
jgi:hypothetical protein